MIFYLTIPGNGTFLSDEFCENMAKSGAVISKKQNSEDNICICNTLRLVGSWFSSFPEQGRQLATCFSFQVFSWSFIMSKVRICNSVLTRWLELPLYLLDTFCETAVWGTEHILVSTVFTNKISPSNVSIYELLWFAWGSIKWYSPNCSTL